MTWPLAIALNSEPVKYAIVALSAPLWIPFFKALWHTLNDGLREEGGLLGRAPTEEQLREIERKLGPAASTLVSIPKDGPLEASGQRRAPSVSGRGADSGAQGRSAGPGGAGRAKPGGPRRTFR